MRPHLARLAAPAALLSLVPAGTGSMPRAEPVQTRRNKLVLVEQFLATGQESTYWTSTSEAILDRGPGARQPIEFGIQLQRFDTAIGGEPPITLVVAEGANRIAIGEDPSTRQIEMPGDLPVERFVNDILDRMEPGLDRSESWTERVRVFDGSVLPGFADVEVDAHFESSLQTLGSVVLRLLTFRTDPVTYESRDSRLDVTFRGAALVDAELELAYHSLFEQSGRVTGPNGVSNLDHVTSLYLADMGDQAVIPVDALSDFESVYGGYRFYGRPELEGMLPEITEERPRPEWATPAWVAGRLANTALGGVAEGSVNPVPVLSLGSVVLTDQSIYYAGNVFVDQQGLQAGTKSESELDYLDGEFRSPLQYALAGEDAEPVPMDERLKLLGPETKAAARIGELGEAAAIIIEIGVTYEIAAALLSTPGKLSALLGSGGAVPAASLVTASTATAATASVSATTIALAGAGAAGAGVAIAEGTGGDESPSGPPPPTDSLDCSGATVVQGGEGTTSTAHEMGPDAGLVTLIFNAGEAVADSLEVFFNGAVVDDTGGEVTGTTTLNFQYTPTGNVTEIVVVVEGGVASVWDYTVSCPQGE